MSEQIADAKHIARARARAARCALDAEQCVTLAEKAAESLLALPEIEAARLVLAYAANAEELDPALAIESLHARGVAVALPRVEPDGLLGLHLYGPGDELERGSFGIGEPRADTPRVPHESIDAVIVPGVAFDDHGRRLGYGGGYYDRLLPMLRPDCVRIGFAYDEQVETELPSAEHDEHVHLVVTPTRVIRPERP